LIIRTLGHPELKWIAGTGELSVGAGVGNLPSQIIMTKQLLLATPDKRYAAAEWPLSILAMHSVISTYGDSTSQPLQTELTLPKQTAAFLQVPQNVTVCKALGAAVPYAIESLNEMASIRSLGLMSYPPRAWTGWRQPRWPDVHLNIMVPIPPTLYPQ
jgi:hypothetical protein